MPQRARRGLRPQPSLLAVRKRKRRKKRLSPAWKVGLANNAHKLLPKIINRELTGLGELNEWLASGPDPRRRLASNGWAAGTVILWPARHVDGLLGQQVGRESHWGESRLYKWNFLFNGHAQTLAEVIKILE